MSLKLCCCTPSLVYWISCGRERCDDDNICCTVLLGGLGTPLKKECSTVVRVVVLEAPKIRKSVRRACGGSAEPIAVKIEGMKKRGGGVMMNLRGHSGHPENVLLILTNRRSFGSAVEKTCGAPSDLQK